MAEVLLAENGNTQPSKVTVWVRKKCCPIHDEGSPKCSLHNLVSGWYSRRWCHIACSLLLFVLDMFTLKISLEQGKSVLLSSWITFIPANRVLSFVSSVDEVYMWNRGLGKQAVWYPPSELFYIFEFKLYFFIQLSDPPLNNFNHINLKCLRLENLVSVRTQNQSLGNIQYVLKIIPLSCFNLAHTQEQKILYEFSSFPLWKTRQVGRCDINTIC